MNKIKSIVRNAILKTIFDDGVHQIGEFSFMGVKQNGVVYSPYGLYSNPKKGSFSVLLQAGGKEDSLIGLVWNPKDRPNLEEGAVALQSDGGKMSVICHPDGKIEIKNDTAELLTELSKILVEIKDALITAGIWEYINAGGAVTPCTVNAVNVALLKIKLEDIIAKIDTMKV